jgi:hypothetical protein
MPNEFFRLGNPWKNLRFPKADKVDVITLLASFKKIIVNLGQILRDLACLHILPIEEAADTGVLGRRQTIAHQQSRDGIKAGLI